MGILNFPWMDKRHWPTLPMVHIGSHDKGYRQPMLLLALKNLFDANPPRPSTSDKVDITFYDMHKDVNDVIQSFTELWIPFLELNQTIQMLESSVYEEDLGLDVNNTIC